MVTKLAKPGAAIAETITPEKAHLLHMAVGIAGEAGELLEGMGLIGLAESTKEVPPLMENLKEELGDLEFYIEGLRQGLAIDRSEIIALAQGGYQPLYRLVPMIGIQVFAAGTLDYVKKHVIYNKDLDMPALLSQLAGLEFHMSQFRGEVGIGRDSTLEHVHTKLLSGQKARYAAGYSDKAAQERADKQ